MKISEKKIKTVLFFLLLYFSGNAQINERKFNHLSLKDGLSQSVILDIVQDSTGFLWIATQDGLNRYDGNEIKILKYSPYDSNTVSSNWINALAVGDDSTLWIGTLRSGLDKLNLKTYNFTHFNYSSKNQKKIFAINNIIPFQNKYLFISTWGDGFYKINLLNNNVKHYKHNAKNSNSINGDMVHAMILSKDKFLWLGTTQGLCKYEIETEHFTQYLNDSTNKLPENFVITLLEDSNNKIWIGTRKGLCIFNEQTNRLIKYTSVGSLLNALSDKTIINLYQDTFGYIWIGTWEGGLNRTEQSVLFPKIDYTNLHFLKYLNSDTKPYSISGNYVRKLFEDRSNNLWIGTWGSSLNRTNLKAAKFHTITGNQKDALHTSHNFIRTFTEDSKGRLWIGTAGRGIDIYNPKKNKFTNYTFSKNKSIGKDRIYSLHTDSQNNIWIGLGDGLVKWNSQKNKFKEFNIKKDMQGITDNILINGIVEYKNYMIFSSSIGLITFNKTKKKFSKLLFNKNIKTNNLDEISCLLKDSKNNLWVGTLKYFLSKLSLEEKDNTLKVINVSNYLNKIPKVLKGSKRVNHINEDSEGYIWISTSLGLYKFDRKNNSLNVLTEKDGLPNDVIYASLEDSDKNIWVSTNKGLARISSMNGNYSIVKYDISDGLQDNEFNQSSCYKSAKGILYFGGINGFSFFNPNELKENTFIPNPVITQIKILNKEIPNLNKVISSKKLIVDYSDKMLTFTLAALEFTNPSKNKYAYKLEGFDEFWIYSGNERHATYTNLNPGKYTLKIKASNDDEIWSKGIDALNITVKPPFWMTWWFITFSIATIFLILFFIHRYRVKRLLEMERLRIKIASDLHDEVGPLLTQISITADTINYDTDIQKIKKRSTSIRDRSREIRSSLSDVIWSIDARKDKFENLIDRMQDFCNSLLDENEIQLTFNKSISDMNKILKVDFRQNIFLIFKESINNAVKHSGGNKITVDVQCKKNEFSMKISDNGKGLDLEKVQKGNGLNNLKMRAQKIHAKISFINKNGLTIALKTNYV